MSKSASINGQSFNGGKLSSLGSWIKDNWKNGLFITSSTYQGDGSWVVVMSKTKKYYDQSYATRSSTKEINEVIESNYNNGFVPTITEYGDGYYFAVCSKLSNYTKPVLKTNLYATEGTSFVETCWSNDYNVVYLGGGCDESSQQSPSSKVDALYELGNALQAFGQALGGNNIPQPSTTYNNNQGAGNYGSGSSGSGHSTSNRCTECLGNGKCSGSGSSSKYHCHGSGKCYACHGKGLKEVAGHLGDCGVCNNTGKCKYCNGTGKCSRCNGTGKL